MGLQDLLVVALFVVAYGLVSGRLQGSLVTPPMVFVGFGLLAGPASLGLVELDLDNEAVRVLAEATLVLVLFTDAARIDLRVLRREYHLPARLLGVGLPLTVAGTLAALVLFDGLELWEARGARRGARPHRRRAGTGVVTPSRGPAAGPAGAQRRERAQRRHRAPARHRPRRGGGQRGGPRWRPGLGVCSPPSRSATASSPALLVGALGGRLVDLATRRSWMSETFRQVSTLAVAAAAYGLSETLGGNGFIAAFTAGLAFGSVARGSCQGVYAFTEEEGQLLRCSPSSSSVPPSSDRGWTS